MKTIYASKHGHSKSVAKKFKDCHDVKDNPPLNSNIILFICPTYGDEELPLEMEEFICSIKEKRKLFVICELGNYYGYDSFNFGAKKILKSYLEELGWIEFFPSLSLDSMPQIDWETFERWKKELENALQNHCRTRTVFHCQENS